MKLMFASDIHGSAYYARELKRLHGLEKPDRLLLLGDLLYHGPRNDLPRDYAPKEVIELLNSLSDQVLCVRGNCDAEVDQMVLEFPILAESLLLYLPDDRGCFLTHGHIYNDQNPPKLHAGDLLIHGHTHVAGIWQGPVYTTINPGSISLPKEGQPSSYMIYQDGLFSIKSLEGKVLHSLAL